MILQRLHILNIDNKHIARLGSLDLEGPGKIVDFGQVDVANIVCRIIVLDLAARPIDTLNLYRLSVLDGSSERDLITSANGRVIEGMNLAIPSGCHRFYVRSVAVPQGLMDEGDVREGMCLLQHLCRHPPCSYISDLWSACWRCFAD